MIKIFSKKKIMIKIFKTFNVNKLIIKFNSKKKNEFILKKEFDPNEIYLGEFKKLQLENNFQFLTLDDRDLLNF